MEFWTTGMGLMKVRALPAALADGHDQYVRDAEEAERLGFDGYGAPEHHFMYDAFVPAPLGALAAAAATTSRIRLLTGAMLLTLYDPLDAAEHAATLDVISNGRLTLGLGMGYRPMEFDGLGTAKRTRGKRLVEAMEVLALATTGDEFSYDGECYRYERARVRPAPVQRPIPMWFCGGTSEAAARRSGRAGLPYWLANSPYDHTAAMVAEYRRIGREAGWPEERLRVAAFKDFCLGDTVAEAEMMRRMLVDAFYEEHILGYGYLVDDDGNHVYNPPQDHPLYRRFLDSIFCGTVEMVIEELRRYESLGVEALWVPPAQRELVASAIIPEFRE